MPQADLIDACFLQVVSALSQPPAAVKGEVQFENFPGAVVTIQASKPATPTTYGFEYKPNAKARPWRGTATVAPKSRRLVELKIIGENVPIPGGSVTAEMTIGYRALTPVSSW
ncbi:MAG: hypothetical protein ACOYON_01335 [Fimbriimonas sp.]